MEQRRQHALMSDRMRGTLFGFFVALVMALFFQGSSKAQDIISGTGSGVRNERIVGNQEAALPARGTPVTSDSPFNVMIDGVPVFGDVRAAAAEDDQRTVDVALDAMDITVQADIENLERAANVESIRRSVGKNVGKVQFFTYWNYGAFIKAAEIRLFQADKSVDGRPVEVIKVLPGKAALWNATDSYGKELQYVLRLYGADGNFDETAPKLLKVDEIQRSSGDEESIYKEALVVYGKDNLVTRKIDISGASVTVSGKKIPSGHRIFVLGVPIPVSDDGEFVTRQILPAGVHNVIIAALDSNNRGLEFQRNLMIPKNDWFYVAVADLTVGAGISKGVSSLVGFEEADKREVDIVGRAAFFLRGKIQGKYILTAMADTTEDDIKNLGKAFTGKDAYSILRRIDPDKDYLVYGDDSTIENLADTSGNLYVKLERGESYVLWGNNNTSIVGSDLAQIRRSLYGAHLHYVLDGETSFGEDRAQLDLYAAQPNSLAQTDVFRGTGGSVYFLNRQDIQIGSEKLRVEVRDPNTGIVVQSRTISSDKDYDVDYIQGRVILYSPLAGTVDDGFTVDNRVLDGNEQYLVVRYEYTPALTDIDGLALGGRAEAWIGDILRVGATGQYEKDDRGEEAQTLYEVDALLRLNAGTYIKGEFAQSKAFFDQTTLSTDGGYDTIKNDTNLVAGSRKANAFRVEAAVDLKETFGFGGGSASAFYRSREAGFSSEGQDTNDYIVDYGVQADIPLGTFLTLKGKYDVKENKDTNVITKTAKLDADISLGERWYATTGVSYSDDQTNGERIDLGGRVGIRIDDFDAYVFGQSTVKKDEARLRNSRIGIGGKAKLTDRLSVGGEVSTGDGGIGGRASAEFQVSDRTTTYLSYELGDLTNSSSVDGTFASKLGTLTFGGRSRYTDALTIYGEERLKHNKGSINGLTHAYGVDYAPNDRWTIGGNFELGKIEDNEGNEINRTAASGSIGYKTDKLNIAGSLEARIDEDSEADTKRVTYLGKGSFGLKFSPDWRLQAKINGVISSANGNFKDGDFIQGTVGFAYRPVNSDRLNALLKYEAYYDLPSSQQQTNTDSIADYKQRSHIVSADVIYQLTRSLSIGAKYGLKLGEVTSSRTSDDWTKSTVHLGILRADWHVVRNWDATVELRGLRQSEIKSTRIGALAAIYRHFGNNFKVGVGYNFSDVSDDLTNVNADAHGFFINAVAKF